MRRIPGLALVSPRQINFGLVGRGIRGGKQLLGRLMRRSSIGWPNESYIDAPSVRVPLTNEIHPEIINIFQTPQGQRSFMVQWVRIALQTLKDGKAGTQDERDCIELLKPIEGQLKEITARRLIPADAPDFNLNKSGCLTLSITLGTPEETLDFFFRFWEFSILQKTGVRVHWTFDRTQLKVRMKNFIPYKATWVPVDHFSRVFPENGGSLCVDHFRSGYRTPAFAGLWSIFYGWMGWISGCGREVGDMILPHPVFYRFYVKNPDGSEGFLHLRADYGTAVRVLVTTINDKEYVSRVGPVPFGQTAFGGVVGLLTSGRRW